MGAAVGRADANPGRRMRYQELSYWLSTVGESLAPRPPLGGDARWEPEPLRWLAVNAGLRVMLSSDRAERSCARAGRPGGPRCLTASWATDRLR
ncbi:hypothetical protein [Micromonospora sp. KC207]|uniref:hypothetical protein n=1 Tax=Micromonospora sp. KC207 TaxID=2530377 RepID=UPI0014055663|nr:hypothetical protein [Micromonospora sp. KC207]